jgi:nucleoside 2-deoxyribosyltransferase
MQGWEASDPIITGGIPGRCFVAMAFDASLDAAYFEAIKPAIVSAGYEPVCMKERFTNDNICDVILAEIRKSQFVVADFTLQKGGVYFEAGFAKALGKEVFWTCQADDFHNLHFDTNHYGHIKWATPEDLRTQLEARIVAELGSGPHARAGT